MCMCIHLIDTVLRGAFVVTLLLFRVLAYCSVVFCCVVFFVACVVGLVVCLHMHLRGDTVVQNGPKPLLSKSLGFGCI